MGGRSLDSWVVDTWPCLFLVSAASHLLSKTCSVVKWAVIDVNVTYLLDVTSMPRSHVTISICMIHNSPCWLRLLPEYRAYKTFPAQRACSLSIEFTKPSLLNKPAPWESSIQNPPSSTSMLTEHQSYNTLPVQRACSLRNELTIPSLLKKPAPRASSLGLNLMLFTSKNNLIKIRSLIRSHSSNDLKEKIKGSNFK